MEDRPTTWRAEGRIVARDIVPTPGHAARCEYSSDEVAARGQDMHAGHETPARGIDELTIHDIPTRRHHRMESMAAMEQGSPCPSRWSKQNHLRSLEMIVQ